MSYALICTHRRPFFTHCDMMKTRAHKPMTRQLLNNRCSAIGWLILMSYHFSYKGLPPRALSSTITYLTVYREQLESYTSHWDAEKNSFERHIIREYTIMQLCGKTALHLHEWDLHFSWTRHWAVKGCCLCNWEPWLTEWSLQEESVTWYAVWIHRINKNSSNLSLHRKIKTSSIKGTL